MQNSKQSNSKQSNSKQSNSQTVGTSMVIGPVRFSYLNAITPRQNLGGKAKYSVSLLIPKSDVDLVKRIRRAINAAAVAGATKFSNRDPKNIKGFKWPLRDGDEKENDEVYNGHWYINASSDTKPGIVDKDRNEIIDADEIYSGMYGRASVNFYAYNNVGIGIGCGLNNLQKLKDGENLTGKKSAQEDFDDEYVFEEQSDEDNDDLD